jgi:hypothetical protein
MRWHRRFGKSGAWWGAIAVGRVGGYLVFVWGTFVEEAPKQEIKGNSD